MVVTVVCGARARRRDYREDGGREQREDCDCDARRATPTGQNRPEARAWGRHRGENRHEASIPHRAGKLNGRLIDKSDAKVARADAKRPESGSSREPRRRATRKGIRPVVANKKTFTALTTQPRYHHERTRQYAPKPCQPTQPLLFLLPTGLAVGLALKEVALRRKRRRFAPGGSSPHRFPRSRSHWGHGIRLGMLCAVHPIERMRRMREAAEWPPASGLLVYEKAFASLETEPA